MFFPSHSEGLKLEIRVDHWPLEVVNRPALPGNRPLLEVDPTMHDLVQQENCCHDAKMLNAKPCRTLMFHIKRLHDVTCYYMLLVGFFGLQDFGPT
jgi:hypothetical protein